MNNKITLDTLSMTYFHKYHMSYDLIGSFIQREMNITEFHLHHFPEPENLLKAAEENKFDIIFMDSSCLFDGCFREVEIRKLLASLCGNKRITTVFFANDMKSVLLKKILDAGADIMISSQDTPQELLAALLHVLTPHASEPYVSQSVQGHLQQERDDLTAKEWEVINLIHQGYSLSEIASKKCRALSTVSTQKRNAMNKLHLKNESELLRFLHQSSFF